MNAWQGVSTLDSNSALMPMETGVWVVMPMDLLSFELAQICVGSGTVPISIVIYIDATQVVQRGTEICPCV